MGAHLTSLLNQSCKSYQETFSPSHLQDSILTHRFPVVKRQPAVKCHDISPWLQHGSRASLIHNGEREEILATRTKLSQEQLNFYSTPEGIVHLNKKGISLAVEKRVALFFQQAILCYGMSAFTFSTKGADSQLGTSPALSFSTKNGQRIIHEREAAHSSTIPTLIAHAKDGSTPEGFVYLKGSSGYDQHQGTIGMHEAINGADELIDGKGNDGKLRETAVKILNRAAQGLDPMRATQEFLQAFKAQVISSQDTLIEEDERCHVLGAYLRRIEKIEVAMQDKELFDHLLGVIIQNGDPNEKLLRAAIYQRRYEIIRLQEVVENRIGKRIADVKSQMGRDASFIEYLLLKEFAENDQRKILEKLFCKTAAIFEADYQVEENKKRSLKSFHTRVRNLQSQHQALIAGLKRNLREDFRELQCAEFTYRAGVFKTLRTVRRMTQKDFCSRYYQTTGRKVSQSWVSRMEQLSRVPTRDPSTYKTPINQRRRYVTLTEGRDCAKTFKVDPGLFLPSLFTS